MGKFTIPAPDAPAEEWGRLAASIPGWRWMPGARDLTTGMRVSHTWPDGSVSTLVADPDSNAGMGPAWPDPDDPATEGCLLRALEPASPCPFRRPYGLWVVTAGQPLTGSWEIPSLPLGRACIAAAAAIGEWPGGAE